LLDNEVVLVAIDFGEFLYAKAHREPVERLPMKVG
jgi:hypothetical protein